MEQTVEGASAESCIQAYCAERSVLREGYLQPEGLRRLQAEVTFDDG